MNGASKGSRMPDVSLKAETLDVIKEETTPIPEEKIFKRKSNMKLEVKEIDDEPVKEVNDEPPAPPKKVKKKLTEKQLEALKRGREKSIATRKAKAVALKLEKEMKKNGGQPPPAVSDMEDMSAHATDMTKEAPVRKPPPQQQFYQPQTLDYDKIIKGLADEQDKRSKARENREHQVAEDIKMYEDKIRADERARILEEVEREEALELQQHNEKKTKSIFNPQIPVNAYSRTSYGGFNHGRSRRQF